MESRPAPRIAIVDYGMGNLYSVRRACLHAGADAVITALADEVVSADGVILPGVGAMPDAMAVLRQTGLAEALRYVARRGTPFLGICLGMQLLMRYGSEFGFHEGLGVVEGSVVRLEGGDEAGRPLRVPHIGWNAVHEPMDRGWSGSLLQDAVDGVFMYFVHSYYVVPADPKLVIAVTRYGDREFCSALRQENVFACQFHPERSGPQGLLLLRNFVAWAGTRPVPLA